MIDPSAPDAPGGSGVGGPRLTMSAAAATDPGLQRSSNEDAFYVDSELGLLAVADGVGGRAAGETASRLALSSFARHVREQLDSTGGAAPGDLLAEASRAGAVAIQRRVAEHPEEMGLATTLTACLVRAGTATFAHVGDSRAYLLRHEAIRQLTEDHTVAGLRAARGQPAEPKDGERKLLAALGAPPWAGVDVFSEPIEPGDLLLLCTDGLTSVVGDDELARTVMSGSTLAERARALVGLANERGGQDNITVVLAAF